MHLPPHIVPLVEMLAENTHEVWAQSRMSQGWRYGPERDDDKRTHNGLVPYVPHRAVLPCANCPLTARTDANTHLVCTTCGAGTRS